MARDAGTLEVTPTSRAVVTPFPVSRRRAQMRLDAPPLAARSYGALSLGGALAETLAASGAPLLALFGYGQSQEPGGLGGLSLAEAAPFLIAAALWPLLLAAAGGRRFAPPHGRLAPGAKLVIGLSFCGAAAALMAPAADPAARTWLALALAGFTGLATASRLGAGGLARRWRRQSRLGATAVIVGAGAQARRLLDRMIEDGDRRVVAVVADGAQAASFGTTPMLAGLEALERWSQLPEVREIVVALDDLPAGGAAETVARLRRLPQTVCLAASAATAPAGKIALDDLALDAIAPLPGAFPDPVYLVRKRIFDFLAGSAIALFVAPLIGILALLVKLDSPGPALFRQHRFGFNNKVITVLKLRTMRHEPRASAGAPMRQVERDDARITRLGRFLRVSSLDELPQIFNVVRGDMSLVGPRPHAVDMRTGDQPTASLVAEYAHRCRVPPGLTGWAQINGSRGPLHSPAEVARRVSLDLDYVRKASLWMDLVILVRTLPVILGDRVNVR